MYEVDLQRLLVDTISACSHRAGPATKFLKVDRAYRPCTTGIITSIDVVYPPPPPPPRLRAIYCYPSPAREVALPGGQ